MSSVHTNRWRPRGKGTKRTPAPEYMYQGKLREPHQVRVPRGPTVDTRGRGTLVEMTDEELDKSFAAIE